MIFSDPLAALEMDEGLGELRAGNLGLRIARSPEELDAAQALRYRVFYEELGAQPNSLAAAVRRDSDVYDAVADHLLVVDHDLGHGPESVVGTYRLIRREAAAAIGRFYSADEYDMGVIDRFPGRVLELGRSCVDSAYRGRAAMQLLWRGIAAYIFIHNIDLMFGCASLPGTDIDLLAPDLSYLYAHHLAPSDIRLRAVPERYVEMQRMDLTEIDTRQVLTGLPPLIKGYLRLGGFVGDGAVIDHQFNTTDVAVVVQSDLVTGKYYRHFGRDRRP